MLFYGNPSPDAELVVLYGNCQIPFLAMLLAAAHGEKGYLCVLNHAPPGQVADRPTPEQMRRCCLYLEQYDSQPELPVTEHAQDVRHYGLPLRKYLRTHCPEGCPRIVFPSIIMTCMWPFSTVGDPRNVAEPAYVWGRYPYGNRLALEVVTRGLKGPSALEAYMQLSAKCMPDLKALLERAQRKLENRDTHCDVKIADYVWTNFRERHLFLTYGHVRAEAIGELAMRTLSAIQPYMRGDAKMARARLGTALAAMPDMDVIEEPIEPAVAEGLGLKFYRPDMRFRWHTQQWTFAEYMRRYLDYDTSW
ncbi:WcbI family polysaccharide biosynthesis putative acetyltransferase [Parazoarcus communis]|uniref:Polysaccharide biosynthesis enzyme WcbI domain-containing protein n=1 Tax=Parazoarcus communis SWub3 = DSM 12120 TaxID=1121029 RepID=A0A323V7L1_9RHOO|nr:WcbI family polysaccharide biosynthesis putative acetyltransferase [Parazoarcus communis]NMG72307.1 hypothetical protein [Parazoarcus communis SWub3 = DSM 12120]PZA16148.1 hypothetical protein DNK49_12560 [Azoarcus communis] [Parazoarcus communis SWub3 = DSM 12120]